jgi:hypothetical protein
LIISFLFGSNRNWEIASNDKITLNTSARRFIFISSGLLQKMEGFTIW